MLLTRLTAADIALAPISTHFVQTAIDTLGNFGDSDDGFDLAMQLPLLSFNSDVDGLALLDQNLLDMDFNPGDLASISVAPVTDDMIAFTSTGDSIMSAFNNTVLPPDPSSGGTAAPPPPPPRQTPPGGGVTSPPQGNTGTLQTSCSLDVDPLTGEVLGESCGVTNIGGHQIPPLDAPPPE